MRPIYEATVAQIDITHACHLACANCTTLVGHHRSPQRMSVDEVRQAIRSLADFPGRVGIMGGQPALHPDFREIPSVMRDEIVDKRRREFWTAGFRWFDYLDDILETFDEDRIAYNDHTQEDGKHQPLLVAIDEVVDDKELMWELIDHCWVQQQWSPAITSAGAFFCEVAAAQAHAMGDLDGAWPVTDDWWNKTPEDFRDQIERYCKNCSAAIPMEAVSDGRGGRDGKTVDVVSPGNLDRLRAAGSPKARRGQFEIFVDKITREDCETHMADWKPSNFRSFVAHTPGDVETALQKETA